MRINNNWHPDMPDEFKNQIVTGDARILAERIPDESIDLIFTDPVYDRIDDYRWLAETASRVLKPDRACLVWCLNGLEGLTYNAMINNLAYVITLQVFMGGPTSGRFHRGIFIKNLPCMWLEKGKSKTRYMWSVQSIMFNPANGHHKWSKPPKAIGNWINALTNPDDVIWDPYMGGGTVPAVCKMLGRNYVAFEIDPATADNARERVQNTQPPLFVLEPEQMDMKLE